MSKHECEHECVFVEEQEPSGRLILGPCLACGAAALETIVEIRRLLVAVQEALNHAIRDVRPTVPLMTRFDELEVGIRRLADYYAEDVAEVRMETAGRVRDLEARSQQQDAERARLWSAGKQAQDLIANLLRQLAQAQSSTMVVQQCPPWAEGKPRVPGWYWWKGRHDVDPAIHYVSAHDIEEGNPPGLWAGPLEHPGQEEDLA